MAPKKDEAYVFSIELFVQDYSLQNTNQVTKVRLGDTQFFRGIKPEELLKAPAGKKGSSQERVWQTLVNLHKFNVHMECILGFNPSSGLLEIRDTEVKEY